MAGRQRVARLEQVGVDMPWFLCTFDPDAAFPEVEPLFTEQERAIEAEDWDAAERVWREIFARLKLVPDDSAEGTIPEFIIRLDGDQARLRYERP